MDWFRSLMPRRRSRARVALLLLLVAAFGAQQWAVQVHWHAGVVAGASSPSGQHGGVPVDRDCLWCQAASHAGTAAAPPATLRLVVAVAGFSPLLASGDESILIAPPAHSWLSRGPPAA
jgi:hypothetical protein